MSHTARNLYLKLPHWEDQKRHLSQFKEELSVHAHFSALHLNKSLEKGTINQSLGICTITSGEKSLSCNM